MCTLCMALRVLLADESSTIKKVMKLALQDFGVDVKSVPLGVDVQQVAKSFQPDVIFADVLLAKMSGYDVAKSLKNDPQLKHIPVVLMWSSFMELDEAKAQECKAEGRLEKPFDAESLRNLVKDLVPNTKDNLISQFLTFPDLPSIIEDEKNKAPAVSVADTLPASDDGEAILMNLEEPEEFQSVPLPKSRKESGSKPFAEVSKPAMNDDWSHQDLSKFRIDLSQSELNSDPYAFDDTDLTKSSIALSSGMEEIALDEIGDGGPLPESSFTNKIKSEKSEKIKSDIPMTNDLKMSVDPMHAEEILRQEARKVLENIAWKLLPDVVERVVREELQKLLKDTERL